MWKLVISLKFLEVKLVRYNLVISRTTEANIHELLLKLNTGKRFWKLLRGNILTNSDKNKLSYILSNLIYVKVTMVYLHCWKILYFKTTRKRGFCWFFGGWVFSFVCFVFRNMGRAGYWFCCFSPQDNLLCVMNYMYSW